MMKRVKRLFYDLTAGAVAVLLICLTLTAPYQVEVHATVPGPVQYTAPANGAGRITTVSKLPSSKKILAAQGEAEIEVVFEAVSASKTEDVSQEELVEVFPEAEPVIETDIDALIVEAAERYNIPWQLVSAVCWAESTYNPYAVSSTPDYGLMQITESVLGAYGLEDWSDPAANLDVGCRILREKMDLSDGDITKALTRYRFGDAEALAMWSRGEWSNWYSERVLGKYYELLRGE